MADPKPSRPGSKRVGVLMIALITLAAGYFVFGLGDEAPKKSANASSPAPVIGTSLKPVQTMNLALGDMVVLARDLGFNIASPENTHVESNKIVLRIESHLQKLREMYRQESGENSALAGTVLLQFKISPSGEVADVTELSSRISDTAFKKVILSEVAKWSFADIVSEHLTVTCPLLFVRQGMDITTLVRWEKSFANQSTKATPSAIMPASAAPALVEKKAAAKTPTKILAIAGDQSQMKYSTSLRKRPDFSSDSLTVIGAGTKVTVIGKAGDWLEVRLNPKGPSGFIRKEFAKAAEVAGD